MDRHIEQRPEDVYLTRAWLEKHGWTPTNLISCFQNSTELIDADLCVFLNRKEYMIAKFHYMGDKAWEPSAKPDSFELRGINNYVDMLVYDHHRLVLAAYVCHLTGIDRIDNAIGGVYDLTMKLREGTSVPAPPEPAALKEFTKENPLLFDFETFICRRNYNELNYLIYEGVFSLIEMTTRSGENPVICCTFNTDNIKEVISYSNSFDSVRSYEHLLLVRKYSKNYNTAIILDRRCYAKLKAEGRIIQKQ